MFKHVDWWAVALIFYIMGIAFEHYYDTKSKENLTIELAKQGLVQKVDPETKQAIWVKSEVKSGEYPESKSEYPK